MRIYTPQSYAVKQWPSHIPLPRAGVADILCRAISRDVIAALRGADLIATGPRSPQPGAPHTYVTTPAFFAKGRYVRLQQDTGLAPLWRPRRNGERHQAAAGSPRYCSDAYCRGLRRCGCTTLSLPESHLARTVSRISSCNISIL